MNTQPTIPTTDTTPAMQEFEFTADLAFELPAMVDPQQFFADLVAVMTSHAETHKGLMGGGTHWQKFVDEDDSDV